MTHFNTGGFRKCWLTMCSEHGKPEIVIEQFFLLELSWIKQDYKTTYISGGKNKDTKFKDKGMVLLRKKSLFFPCWCLGMTWVPCWAGIQHFSTELPWSPHQPAPPSLTKKCALHLCNGFASLLKQIQETAFYMVHHHFVHIPAPPPRISSPSPHPHCSITSLPGLAQAPVESFLCQPQQ